jgi:hypothetical protein
VVTMLPVTGDSSPETRFGLLRPRTLIRRRIVPSSFSPTGRKRNVVVVVTPIEARQISNDTGRNELLPETRSITMPDAAFPGGRSTPYLAASASVLC